MFALQAFELGRFVLSGGLYPHAPHARKAWRGTTRPHPDHVYTGDEGHRFPSDRSLRDSHRHHARRHHSRQRACDQADGHDRSHRQRKLTRFDDNDRRTRRGYWDD
jgi:hypothetical protein